MNKNAIAAELKRHAPYTIGGALSGIALLAVVGGVSRDASFAIFYTLHPLHVFLSALTTTSLFVIHRRGANKRIGWGALLGVGLAGSIGIATVSDSLIPYIGEILLGLPRREPHIGFIERWQLVNPLALAGILWARFKPLTREPHAGHTLLSTYASLFHMIMATDAGFTGLQYVSVFLFLLLAVWIPVAAGDIVLPLLFVRPAPDHR
jgi:hypothetical protein